TSFVGLSRVRGGCRARELRRPTDLVPTDLAAPPRRPTRRRRAPAAADVADFFFFFFAGSRAGRALMRPRRGARYRVFLASTPIDARSPLLSASRARATVTLG